MEKDRGRTRKWNFVLSYEINSKTNGRIQNYITDTNTAIQW